MLILASHSFLLSLESFSDLHHYLLHLEVERNQATLLIEQSVTAHDVTILSGTLL